MKTLCIIPKFCSYLILILWIVSSFVFWAVKNKLSKELENQSRYFLAFILVTGILIVIFLGKGLGIPNEYLSNITTEIIGIAITVFLIDRVYNYINHKNEELFRKLSLKACKMPIYTYCAYWFFIYEPDSKKLDKELSKYIDLASFFNSDDFYRKVIEFNFNKLIGENKTYAQYYNEKVLEINDRFQSILSKYASKLSPKDIPLLEHFGGRAFIFKIFAVMKFFSEVEFTSEYGDASAKSIKPFNNSFKNVKREKFNKHFDKLIELINIYNSVVDNDYEKWTIKNISKLTTLGFANDNPTIEW